MSVYIVVVGLLLTTPWVLFGVVIIGAASSALGRWLGRPRRPYRVGTRRQPTPLRAKDEVGQSPVRIVEAGKSRGIAQRSQAQAGPANQRRAA